MQTCYRTVQVNGHQKLVTLMPACNGRKRVNLACFYRRSQSTVAPQTNHDQYDYSRHRNGHNGTHSNGAKGVKPPSYKTKSGKNIMPSTRSVKFHVRYKTEFGQEVYLVGNCNALGNWDVMSGVRLNWSAGHVWEGSVDLPAGLHVQYKYVVRTNDGAVVRWQEGENVSLDLPGGSAAALALDVEDSWNKSKQVKRILAAGTPVRFNIRLKVEFGQQLVVVGSCGSLGGWNVDNAVRLNWQEGHVWETSIELPAGELVEYKYVVKSADGTVDKWQDGDNLKIEVPVAQGQTGRRRGVLVLDSWAKASNKKPSWARSFGRQQPGSWRSTPYSSLPAGDNGSGVAVHTDSPRFGTSFDIDNASAAVAARSYYSMMDHQSSSRSRNGSSSGLDQIRDPAVQHPDPSVMQHWTDKPRFPTSAGQHQAHQDPWKQQQHQPDHEDEQFQPRIFVPQPHAGASTEAYARWQALQSVMAALQHSAELDHWTDDPTDPRMLAADRRLAALTASLGTGTDSVAAAAAAVV